MGIFNWEVFVQHSRLFRWPPTPRERWHFALGFRHVLPAMVATSVWGFVTGIAMLKSGLSEAQALLMTFLVYAGSAQLTALPLLESQAPLWLIFVAGFVVNIRFLIFGAALQPFFRHYNWRQRFFLGYLTSDIAFALFMAHYGEAKKQGTHDQLWYFLGMILPGWLSWQLSSVAGVYYTGLLTPACTLDYAAILALLAILVPLVTNRALVICLIVAALTAWVGQLLPLRLGLVTAVFVGMIAGVVAEQLYALRKGVQ